MSEADGNMSKKDGNPPKEGEESFNEEIKDYAKTTMNELLGMFGYDDEMTSESVSSLEIKVPTPPDDLKRAGPSTAMTPVLSVPNQTTAASMATVSMAPAPAPVLILSGHGMKSNDTPIIVKVEGSTSASDVVRKQNSEAMAQSPIQIQIPSTISLPAVTVSAPATAVRTQGPAVEPALTYKTDIPFLKYTIQTSCQKLCTWCKKPAILRNYSFHDGARVLECRGICSQECFEKAALSIKVNNDHIRSVQDKLRELPSKRSTIAATDGAAIASAASTSTTAATSTAAVTVMGATTAAATTTAAAAVTVNIVTSPASLKAVVSPPTRMQIRALAPVVRPSTVAVSSSTQPRALAPAPRGLAPAIVPMPSAPRGLTPVNAPMPSVPTRFSFPAFNWDQYLVQTGAEAAPWSYFRQAPTPPYNGFKIGMKLEVADPRIVDNMCVGTVVGVLGSRIRLRFDGTDASNDVWQLVDSNEIHPMGWCEQNGGMLQPPMGFKKDPGTYQTFLTKTLLDAELAPGRLFKKEPAAPDTNMFRRGMKIEALDPKNHALICVASVGDVQEDKIRIDFDGYLGSDYWAKYDSRDIFPPRWCNFSGHPLQPPGNSKKAQKAAATVQSSKLKEVKEEKKTPTRSRSASTSGKHSQDALPSPTSSPDPSSPPDSNYSPSESAASSDSEKPESEAEPPTDLTNSTVQVFFNRGCEVGSYLHQQKVLNLPTFYQGKIGNVVKECIQSIVDCAHDQKFVFGFLKPGNGKATIYARSNKQVLSCVLQNVDRVAIFWKVLERFLENLGCCDNLLSGEKVVGVCSRCKRPAYKPPALKRRHYTPMESTSRAKVSKIVVDDDDVSSPQVCSTSPAKTWSVDEVVKHMEKTELAEHISLFKVHEIDGRALLLLTRQMIMSYMGLKLGPAIKLLSIVDELKGKPAPT